LDEFKAGKLAEGDRVAIGDLHPAVGLEDAAGVKQRISGVSDSR
jgi:hypothetical protein